MPDSLRLRALSVDDAAAMAAVLADVSLYDFTGGEPPTAAELARRYVVLVRGGSTDGSETWINAVVERDGEPIGYVQATITNGHRHADLAWVIGRPWQGHGYATSAALLLAGELSGQGVEILTAHIAPTHIASQRVAQRLGMTPTRTVVDGETRWQVARRTLPPTRHDAPAAHRGRAPSDPPDRDA